MPNDQSLANAQQLLSAMPRSCLTPAIREDQKKAEVAVVKKYHKAAKQQEGQNAQPRSDGSRGNAKGDGQPKKAAIIGRM